MNAHVKYTGRTRIMRLEMERTSIKDRLARIEHEIAATKTRAVEDGMAMWTPGNPRELAPNKSWWIENEGIDRWNEVKSQSKASDIFAWLIG